MPISAGLVLSAVLQCPGLPAPIRAADIPWGECSSASGKLPSGVDELMARMRALHEGQQLQMTQPSGSQA